MSDRVVHTLGEQVTAFIRNKILCCEYAPGSHLSQDAIASTLGVSKIPVREALLYLQGEGLVSIQAHRSVKVRELSEDEIGEIFKLRLLLEPVAIQRGSRAATDRDRDAAKSALDGLLGADRVPALLDRNFHLALTVPRLQPMTSEVLGRLLNLSQLCVPVSVDRDEHAERVMCEHEALYKAWAAGDLKQTDKIVRGHIEATHKRVDACLRSRVRTEE